MKPTLIAALFGAAIVSLPAVAQAPKSQPRGTERTPVRHFPAGEPGNPREPAVEITITMQETYDGKMLFGPEKIDVPLGQQVKFVLTNFGNLDHSFVIGTDGEAKERQVQTKPLEPNARFVPAATQADILWRFSKPGKFEFASVLPGQYAAGMKGTISVGESTPED